MERSLLRGRGVTTWNQRRRRERLERLGERPGRLNRERSRKGRKQRRYAEDGTGCSPYKRHVRSDHCKDTVLEHPYPLRVLKYG